MVSGYLLMYLSCYFIDCSIRYFIDWYEILILEKFFNRRRWSDRWIVKILNMIKVRLKIYKEYKSF